MIGDWGDGTITTDQFIAAYESTSDTVLGFSNALTSGTAGKTKVQVSDISNFDYTQLANEGPLKDIIRTLGVLKQLPPVEYAPGALERPDGNNSCTRCCAVPTARKTGQFLQGYQ